MAINTITCRGGIFLSKDTKRFLFLLRNNEDVWGFVGGQKDPADQTPFETLTREIKEEISSVPNIEKVVPLELFTSNDSRFHYHTYILIVEKEFIPVLNDEHIGYAWVSYNKWPRPLHQAVKTSLNNKANKTKLEVILDLI
jgi:hypothetical protein